MWFSPTAQFSTEWRDEAATYPQNIGPSVRFDGNGNVTAGGKVLMQVPAETWVHVEIEAALGKDAPRTFKLTLAPAGASARTFDALPMPGAGFRELHWLGFSSTAAADTAFYLDNMRIGPAPALNMQRASRRRETQDQATRPILVLGIVLDQLYQPAGDRRRRACRSRLKSRTPCVR